MVDKGNCPHSQRHPTLSCCKLWDFCRQISWYTSFRLDKTDTNYLRGGYGSIYGWGNSRISLLEAATNFLKLFNMCTMMARQGGSVQLEQSNMCLALNMANMAKGGFLCATREKTRYLIKKPCAEVREEKKRGEEFLGHKKVKAVIEIHRAMFRQNHTPGYLPRQQGTAQNRMTRWRCTGTGAPPPHRHRQQTPEPTPEPTAELTLEQTSPLRRTPPALTGNTSGDQWLEIITLLAGHAHSHISLPCTESFTLDTSGQDSEHDTDFNPDILPDEGTSTG